MNLQIQINLDNAAFELDCEYEVTRILNTIARRFKEARANGTWLTVRDINGNDVGRFAVREEALHG